MTRAQAKSAVRRNNDFSGDDMAKIGSITVVSPGVGNKLREQVTSAFNDILKKHGMRAFEMPKRAAAIHEAGHVVINAILKWPATDTSIKAFKLPTGDIAWSGWTEAEGGEAIVTFDDCIQHARKVTAGLAAEVLFAGDDLREGSSLDELIAAQMLCAQAAGLRPGYDEKMLWRNDVWGWCMAQLHHNRDVHAEIVARLMKRHRVMSATLRKLSNRVQELTLDVIEKTARNAA